MDGDDGDGDGGWGDLFALASGVGGGDTGGGGEEEGGEKGGGVRGDSSSDGRRRRDEEEDDDDDDGDDTGGGLNATKKQKKRRKRSKTKHKSSDQPQKQKTQKFQKQMTKYLAGRMDVEVEQSIVPSWMFLNKERRGGNNKSSLWSSRTGSSSSSSCRSFRFLFDTNPPYDDEFSFSYSNWPLGLFKSIVNLRSIGKHVALNLQSLCSSNLQQATTSSGDDTTGNDDDDDDATGNAAGNATGNASNATDGGSGSGDDDIGDVREVLLKVSSDVRTLCIGGHNFNDAEKNPACKEYTDCLLGSCDNLLRTMTMTMTMMIRDDRNCQEGPDDTKDEYAYELFELSVDVMAKCDDLYFRLYYDQITNNLPPSSSREKRRRRRRSGSGRERERRTRRRRFSIHTSPVAVLSSGTTATKTSSSISPQKAAATAGGGTFHLENVQHYYECQKLQWGTNSSSSIGSYLSFEGTRNGRTIWSFGMDSTSKDFTRMVFDP